MQFGLFMMPLPPPERARQLYEMEEVGPRVADLGRG